MSLATEFLRAVRGKRSQVNFSRRLGYASNVAAEWESGRREPSAARALSACLRCGIDVRGAVSRFHEPSALQLACPAPSRHAEIRPAQVAAWLRGQRSDRRLTELANATGLSLFQVSRASTAQNGPK
jgi:transcriptional regulator with XRE-family HTH domain